MTRVEPNVVLGIAKSGRHDPEAQDRMDTLQKAWEVPSFSEGVRDFPPALPTIVVIFRANMEVQRGEELVLHAVV